jgi:hypothetical protein
MPDVIQYMVRDPQGNVYGPANMETLKQWVREGRITAAMQLAPEGSVDWKPAAGYPELQGMFSPEVVAGTTGQTAPPQPAAGNPTPQTPAATQTYATPGGTPQTNPLAIASLVCSILGCCCVLGIIGIVLGVVAKNQIKASGGQQQGDGIATAGIIVGIITTILGLCLTSAWRIHVFRSGAF